MVHMVRRARARWLQIRAYFPPSGRGYELFDGAFLLAAVSIFAYVLAPQSVAPSRQGLEPLQFITQAQLGWIIFTVSSFALICSYTRNMRAISWGYIAAVTAALSLSANFVWAWGRSLNWDRFLEPGPTEFVWGFIPWFDPGLLDEKVNWVSLGSAMLYGWVARKLIRDNLREIW